MKKVIAMLLITDLVIELTSCSTYRQLSDERDFKSYQSIDDIQVLDLHSRLDGKIVFNEKFPGKIENEHVFGFQQRHFPYSASNSIIFNTRELKPIFIENKGIQYRILSQDKTGFICVSLDTIRTPISEIVEMKLKQKDPLKTSLLIAGLSSVFIGMLAYLIGSNFTIYTQGM